MIPPSLSELLTAYVDGELNSHQRRSVRRLLRRSAQARALLRQLQDDAQRLRQLPPRKLGSAFSEQVLQAITDRGLRPTPLAAGEPGVSPWLSSSAAAAVLLTVGLASYLYFAGPPAEERPGLPVAANDRGSKPEDQETRSEQPGPKSEGARNDPAPLDPRPPIADTRPGEVVPGPGRRPDGHGPEAPADLVASPIPKLEMFEVVDPRVSLLLTFRELTQDRSKWLRLQEEVAKEGACRVELFCRETARAFDRLNAAFLAQGVRPVVDQQAQARLTNRLKTNYVLYTEELTPEELVKILQRLGSEDPKAEANRKGDPQFENVWVNRLTPDDTQELAKLLGVEATQLQGPRPKGPLGVDIRKPLAETTVEQVVRTLTGQGTPSPEAAQSLVKKSERLALVLAYNPVRAKAALSKEVKLFLDSRKDRRPGTLQLLLVLRGVGG